MQRESLAGGHERGHQVMRLLGRRCLRHKPQAPADAMHVRVDREDVSTAGEQQRHGCGLDADAVLRAEQIAGLGGVDLVQSVEAQLAESLLHPSEGVPDADAFLVGKASRTDGAGNIGRSGIHHIPPGGKGLPQRRIRAVTVPVVGALRKDGTNQAVERRGLRPSVGCSEAPFEEFGDASGPPAKSGPAGWNCHERALFH